MSTEHITDELDKALKASKALKAKNDRERKRLLEEQEAADQNLVDNVEAAAAVVRAAQQQHEDASEQRRHRLAQANRIAGVSEPEPDPEPQAPVEPAPAPAPVDHDAAGNPPTAVVPVVVPAPEPTPPRNNLNLRNWRGIAWLFAFVGAVIGLVIARLTYDPMWSNVSSDTWHWHTVLVVLWFAALGFAFGLTGGWFGATREEKRNNPPAA